MPRGHHQQSKLIAHIVIAFNTNCPVDRQDAAEHGGGGGGGPKQSNFMCIRSRARRTFWIYDLRRPAIAQRASLENKQTGWHGRLWRKSFGSIIEYSNTRFIIN